MFAYQCPYMSSCTKWDMAHSGPPWPLHSDYLGLHFAPALWPCDLGLVPYPGGPLLKENNSSTPVAVD